MLFMGLITGIAFVSCRQTKFIDVPFDTVDKITTEVYTPKDTLYDVKADTSLFRADIVVNDTGGVSLANIKVQKGDNLKAPNVSIKDNILRVNCEAEAYKLFLQWKEKYIKESIVIKSYVPPNQMYNSVNNSDAKQADRDSDNELTYWQETQVWLGRILLLLIVIGVANYLYKKKPKFS